MAHHIRSVLSPLLTLPLALFACGDSNEAPEDLRDDAGDAGVDTFETGDSSSTDDASDDVTDVVVADAPGDTSPSVVEQLEAHGPANVGFRLDEVTYVPADRAEPRTLRLALWYPASEGGTQGTTYNGLVDAPNVFVDAPLQAGSQRPLLIYSHGHLGFAEVSSFLAEHLASHGWIVAAPDHTGNTTGNFGARRATEIYYLRSWDIGAVLDWLASDESGGINSQLGDDVVVAGHSFGGYTGLSLAGAEYAISTIAPQCSDGTDTSEFCSSMTDDAAAIFASGLRDERIDAAVLMAAGDFRLFGDEGIAAIDIPLLVMTGTADTDVVNATNADPLWRALTTELAWRVDLIDAPHNSFTTICAQELGVAFNCDPESPLPAEWQRTVLVFATAFVRQVIDGDASVLGVLDGSIPVSDTATLVPRP
jgi:predicted dienelactone hydrolase